MPIIHAIVLGLTQGLAEFLPISSSGHLIVVPWLFGWDDFAGDEGLKKSFDVALHIGTLFAVIGYFRGELVAYVRDGLKVVVTRRRPDTQEGRLAWLLVVSAIPAAVVGAALSDWIDTELGGVRLIAVQLVVFGLLLGAADRMKGERTLDDYTMRDALLIGAGQVCALSPGVSRSGSTMTVGRFLGFTRDAAARASFLMALPVTVGAVLYKSASQLSEGVPSDLWPPLAVGIVTSAVSGWAAVWGTLRLVRTKSFSPFVIYRVVLGIVIVVVAGAGWR